MRTMYMFPYSTLHMTVTIDATNGCCLAHGGKHSSLAHDLVTCPHRSVAVSPVGLHHPLFNKHSETRSIAASEGVFGAPMLCLQLTYMYMLSAAIRGSAPTIGASDAGCGMRARWTCKVGSHAYLFTPPQHLCRPSTEPLEEKKSRTNYTLVPCTWFGRAMSHVACPSSQNHVDLLDLLFIWCRRKSNGIVPTGIGHVAQYCGLRWDPSHLSGCV